jgi:hypothetical protein
MGQMKLVFVPVLFLQSVMFADKGCIVSQVRLIIIEQIALYKTSLQLKIQK